MRSFAFLALRHILCTTKSPSWFGPATCQVLSGSLLGRHRLTGEANCHNMEHNVTMKGQPGSLAQAPPIVWASVQLWVL